jgi:ribonuclease P protein component
MFASMRRHVLRSPWQFRRVYREGHKVDCQYAVLFYHNPDDGGRGLEFGFVASKRVGNAVKRNRAKRLLRDAAAHIKGRIIDQRLWLVLVAKPGLLGAEPMDLERTLSQRLSEAGLIAVDPTTHYPDISS